MPLVTKKIKVIKKIDYWLGIPICALLSMLNGIGNIFSIRKIGPAAPKKILFLELSETGSAILAYPAIEKAKKAYPEAELYFWIFAEIKDSIQILDVIPDKNVITMRSNNIFLLFIDVISNLRQIWKERIDVVVDMELFSRFTSILSYLSRAKVRAGFYKYRLEGLYRGNLHTHRVIYNPYIHISKNFVSLVNALQESPTEIPLVKRPKAEEDFRLPKINITLQDKEHIWRKLQDACPSFNKDSKIAVINFGLDEKVGIRRWPSEYYLALIQRILQEDIFVVLVGIGTSATIPVLAEYKRCINLIGKTTFKDLIELFNVASVLISHDNGINHIASLTNIYIIALFGPETPLLYKPLAENKKIFYKNFSCSPCLSAYNHRSSVCNDNKCLKAITVDEVYNEIKAILSNDISVLA